MRSDLESWMIADILLGSRYRFCFKSKSGERRSNSQSYFYDRASRELMNPSALVMINEIG